MHFLDALHSVEDVWRSSRRLLTGKDVVVAVLPPVLREQSRVQRLVTAHFLQVLLIHT